jgi:pilus assembly protein CpaB
MQPVKNKTVVLLVVALVCGLGAAFLTARLIADRSKPQQEEKVDVLVAKGAVPQYKPLLEPEKYFVSKSVTKSEAPKGALSKFDDLRGKRLKVPLSADKVVTHSDLLDDKNTGAGMAGLVPDGFLAVSIEVSASSGVAGFILPHTKVDVLATLKRNDVRSTAQIILQDVLVLAVGNRSDRDENTQSMVAHTVTLALSPEDAMKVSLVSEVAQLRLALRGDGDTKQREIKPIKLEDVIKPTPGDPDSGTPVVTKNGGSIVVGGLPLDPLTKAPAEEFKKPDPVWRVQIREGDRVRVQEFYRNKNGDLVSGGDARAEKVSTDPKKEETPTPPATDNKEGY